MVNSFVPSGLQALVLDTDLGRRVPCADSRIVLAELHVQRPVQPIFDATMAERTYDQSSVPVDVYGLSDAVGITAGRGWEPGCEGAHTCALSVTARASCWGCNSFGQLGTGTIQCSPFPVQPVGL